MMDFLRTIFVGGVGDTEVWAPLILRVALGLGLLVHGVPKLKTFAQFTGYVASLKWPVAKLFATLAVVAEVGGGVLLMLGLFIKPTAAILALYFLFVILTAHRKQGFVRGWELPFLYFVGVLALWALNSSGAVALSSVFFGE